MNASKGSFLLWGVLLFSSSALLGHGCGSGGSKGGADAAGTPVIPGFDAYVDPWTNPVPGVDAPLLSPDASPLGGQGGSTGAGGAGGQTGTAPACGLPGTACCPGNSCTGGGCCVSGLCMSVGGSCVSLGGGLCKDGACGACGGPGLPCCGSNPATGVCTASGTRCNGGICAKCGDLNMPCCQDATGAGVCSGSGAVCSNGLCTACGSPGMGCCPGNQCSTGCCFQNLCVGEGGPCGTTSGSCQAGRCSGCGSATQPCCGTSCYDDLTCKAGVCASCGNAGESCCAAGGTAARCKAGNTCTRVGTEEVCVRCGTLGDVCCTGNTCSQGCCSAAGICAATGCATTPDAGTIPDAPKGGTGGNTGIGGAGGTTVITTTTTGGMGGSASTTVLGGSTATGGAVGCGAVIDDMEAHTGSICQGNGRVGHWFTYVDSELTTSTIFPPPGTVAQPELLATPRGTSLYAMHASGRFYSYAGIGCLLNTPTVASTPSTYDGSGYTGIKFYAKGTGGLKVTGQMPATQSIENGGTCTAITCTPNSYSYGTLSSTSWTQISIPFSYLKGGLVTPFKSSVIWSLEFQPYTAGSFDLWIDDLTFY